ncbi:hypothetical protein H1R17_10945 [Flavobacterium sp. xlx-214]|uniref:LEM-3-like GIY-YIG domain-containing protein n=1 Tax=unclassified Flavobacterium TaxID=196869 RepID=UPI0013CFD723|nr:MULTISPECIES: hypothetical protein [unclassified Flavobacterium]MBA5791730.1 hypothetical protein [Flavobacterium sp. xlx-221]QMI82969.1 hypothetical protein H1R17_10945 [Flavobacterium sp. xlx-214]
MNNFKIQEFPPEVIKELNYYVYRLIDPRNGDTFYIGKGQGNRIFEHLKCSISEDDDEETFDLKYQRIREIMRSGLDVIHIIHRHGLDSATAFHVEAALLDAFPGTANKVGGHYSNDIGPMNAYEILTRYKAETAELKHKIILININRTVNDRDIYNAVRFAWKLDVERAEKAEYVLALEKGIIVGVFKPLQWNLARKQYFPEFENHTNKRYGFVGEEADKNIQKLYLRKRVPENYRKKGASNPVKYTYKK